MKRIPAGLFVVAMGLCLCWTSAWAASDQQEKIEQSLQVLEEIMLMPEKGIPPTLLGRAYGVAVIPNLIKAGFVIGGRYGAGVLSVRNADGVWSAPLFISLAGGSIGWQIGAQSTDIVLVFKSRRSIDGITSGKFTIGGDASAAAGPVGRHTEAATDVTLKAEIYSYSRSRGLFAGVSLAGASLSIDHEANAGFYRKEGIAAQQIIDGYQLPQQPEAVRLQTFLQRRAAP